MVSKQTLLNTLKIYKNKLAEIFITKKEITQAAYNALSDSEKNNGTMYLITDVENTVVQKEVTQAQYNALSDAEKKNGTVYFITDGTDTFSAGQIAYDNSTSGLKAVDVKGAIDEIRAKTPTLNNTSVDISTLRIGKCPSDVEQLVSAALPTGYDSGNSYILAVRIERQDGAIVYMDDGKVGTTYLDGINKINFVPTSFGASYCAGNYVSAIICKVDSLSGV